jgi:hypothetical protein
MLLTCLFCSYFTHSDGVRDARPEVAYQVGVTKEYTEKARDNSAILTKLAGENKAVSPIVPVYDAKVILRPKGNNRNLK